MVSSDRPEQKHQFDQRELLNALTTNSSVRKKEVANLTYAFLSLFQLVSYPLVLFSHVFSHTSVSFSLTFYIPPASLLPSLPSFFSL